MTPHVVIIGAGAAGAAAARTLAAVGDALRVSVIGATDERPYNRTLVNKAVAVGLLSPEQAALPGADVIADSAHLVDLTARTVELESGTTVPFDSLILASGSAARPVPHAVPGAFEAYASGHLTPMHSLHDGARVRATLEALQRPARVVILGAGLIAAETASLLHDHGHAVTLVARSITSGSESFGATVAATVRSMHERNVSTRFGHTVASFRPTSVGLEIELDDGEVLVTDLTLVAHGTIPTGPAPWRDGAHVDDQLRVQEGIYAAGGVAHHDDSVLGPWRIDHWTDAVAQGDHAARTALFDLDLGADPGRYRPTAGYTASLHGMTIAGAGLAGEEVALLDAPVVVGHRRGEQLTGIIGIDAVAEVFGRIPHLHEPLAADTATS